MEPRREFLERYARKTRTGLHAQFHRDTRDMCDRRGALAGPRLLSRHHGVTGLSTFLLFHPDAVFKRAPTLSACHDRFFAQSFEDWELGAVDAGTGDARRRYCATPPCRQRVRCVRGAAGIAAALNAGNAQCRASGWREWTPMTAYAAPYGAAAALARFQHGIVNCGGWCGTVSMRVPSEHHRHARFNTWVNAS